MKIRAGYEISYDFTQPTPMIVTLSVHSSRTPDLLTPDRSRCLGESEGASGIMAQTPQAP